MNMHDIQLTLEWIAWRESVRRKGYSAEYLDNMAKKFLRELAEDLHASAEAVQLAVTRHAQAKPNVPGHADETCIDVCRSILGQASDDDLTQMLANNPTKIVLWRRLWNKYRSKKRTR